jgi:hypothetical protein
MLTISCTKIIFLCSPSDIITIGLTSKIMEAAFGLVTSPPFGKRIILDNILVKH